MKFKKSFFGTKKVGGIPITLVVNLSQWSGFLKDIFKICIFLKHSSVYMIFKYW